MKPSRTLFTPFLNYLKTTQHFTAHHKLSLNLTSNTTLTSYFATSKQFLSSHNQNTIPIPNQTPEKQPKIDHLSTKIE
jgi:hypothetical protein